MRITPACGTALTAGSGVTCRSPSAALSAMRRLSAGHPRGFFPSALFIYGVSYQSAGKFARQSCTRLSRALLKHFRLRASLPSLRSFPKKFCPLPWKRKRGGSPPGVLHEKSALHKRSALSINLFSRDKEILPPLYRRKGLPPEDTHCRRVNRAHGLPRFRRRSPTSAVVEPLADGKPTKKDEPQPVLFLFHLKTPAGSSSSI